MKAKNRKRSKPARLIFTIIIAGLIGLTFGFGVGKGYMANNKLVNAIENKLQQTCDCEIVKSDISAVGIQFSTNDGLSNSQADFILENCKFSTSEVTEAIRLNNILKKDIENYNSIDLITFHFKSQNNIKTIKIKDGSILQSDKS